MSKVAILVDGGFYRRVAPKIWGDKTSTERANELIKYCNYHIKSNKGDELYRIFYYDCPPYMRDIFRSQSAASDPTTIVPEHDSFVVVVEFDMLAYRKWQGRR